MSGSSTPPVATKGEVGPQTIPESYDDIIVNNTHLKFYWSTMFEEEAAAQKEDKYI